MRRRFQIVFQDPYASLNPRMTVGAILGEPLKVHFGLKDEQIDDRVGDLLRTVGLAPEHTNRFPHEFSGGQRQRVGIARALALEPELIVLDEPVSALDVSIQAGVVNLLQRLQDELGLAYVFIAHDLSVVRHISDRVSVMYLGKIVETGDPQGDLREARPPVHPGAAVGDPAARPEGERTRERSSSPATCPARPNPPSGCRFRTRCWRKRELEEAGADTSVCVEQEPLLQIRREQRRRPPGRLPLRQDRGRRLALPVLRPSQESPVLTAITAALNVLASLILIVLVLLHSGKGGGLSDMFGGGMGASAMGSTVMERNLDRLTVVVALVWGFTVCALSLMLG